MAPMEVETVATVGARKWSPGSWRSCETLQMATYEDQDQYAKVMSKLSKVPPLVQAGEGRRVQCGEGGTEGCTVLHEEVKRQRRRG